MEISLEDMARLRPLLQFAIQEAEDSLKGESLIKSDSEEDLKESLVWGRGFLKRIEVIDT